MPIALCPSVVAQIWARARRTSGDNGTTYRWLGGETKRGVIGIDSELSGEHSLSITGMPQAPDALTAEVQYAGEHVGTLTFGVREFDQYSLTVT